VTQIHELATVNSSASGVDLETRLNLNDLITE